MPEQGWLHQIALVSLSELLMIPSVVFFDCHLALTPFILDEMKIL